MKDDGWSFKLIKRLVEHIICFEIESVSLWGKECTKSYATRLLLCYFRVFVFSTVFL